MSWIWSPPVKSEPPKGDTVICLYILPEEKTFDFFWNDETALGKSASIFSKDARFRFGNDFIIFGGGSGQPQQNDELNELCQDVIDIAKKYDAKFIYTVGGFHTSRRFGKYPTTYVTTTSKNLLDQVQKLGIETTPQESVITGFNGLILGYAKLNGINGMGLYGELLEPNIPQYRAAKSIIQTLEKLTYQKLGDLGELDVKANAVDNQLKGGMKDDYDA